MSASLVSGSERRRFVRYTLKATADVVFGDGVIKHGDLENISTGGMFLNLDYDIPKKLQSEKLRASIRAIFSGEEVTIEAECSIVRVEPGGLAVFFSAIDSDNRKILHDLIGELNDLVRDSRKN